VKSSIESGVASRTSDPLRTQQTRRSGPPLIASHGASCRAACGDARAIASGARRGGAGGGGRPRLSAVWGEGRGVSD
jgi:hypothetical protein